MIADNLLQFFAWLGLHPWAYWSAAWGCFAMLPLSAAWPMRSINNSAKQKSVFLVLLALVLAAFRWPALFHGDLWNMDECQMIAGAITLGHNPLPWLAVDPTSTGPLDDYVLLLPRLFGAPCNYLTARLVGLLLVWSTLSATYLTLRTRASERAARIGTLPLAAFFCFTAHWDFIHYSSEHLPFCLLTLAAWLLFSAYDRATGKASLFLCGLCLGAVPFAKLQGAPLSLWTAFTGAVLILTCKQHAVRSRIKRLLLFCAGGLAPALLLLAVLLAYGIFNDFYQSYIVNNLAYAKNSMPLQAYIHFVSVGAEAGFRSYILPCLGYALSGAIGFMLLPARFRMLFGYALGAGIAAIYAIIAPGHPHGHYFLFLIPPLGLAAGTVFCGHWEKLAYNRSGWKALPQWVFVLLLPLACVAPQICVRATTENPYLGSAAVHHELTSSPVSELVLYYARPGDSMAMWGWMPNYYVETGLRQGTREAQSERQLSRGPQQGYYLQRYYEDFLRERPAFFLDAVGLGNFGYGDRAQFAHETFPPLGNVVSKEYLLLGDIMGVRLYIRKDRTSH